MTDNEKPEQNSAIASGEGRRRLVTNLADMKPLALFIDQLPDRKCDPHTHELPPGCTLVTQLDDMLPLTLFMNERQLRQTRPHNEIE